MIIASRFVGPKVEQSLSGEPGDYPVLGHTLAARQDWAVRLNGCRWADANDSESILAQLWIREDVFLTTEALTLFLEIARTSTTDVAYGVCSPVAEFIEELRLGENSPMIVWTTEPCSFDEARIQSAAPLSLKLKVREVVVPVPPSQFGVDAIALPLSDCVVLPMAHWSQVLWANLLGIGPYLWRDQVGHTPIKAIFRLLKLAIKARSFDPVKVIKKMLRKGSNCKIHPTAVVEGCWLGDNVVVGANAVVRGCILADGARVEDLAVAEFAVLSERAVVQRQAMVKFAVLGRSAAVGGVIQMGVLDQSAALKRGAYLMDLNLSGETKIEWDERRCVAPLGLIGCGVGSETTVGLGVSVAAGRWVSAQLQIVAGGGTTLTQPKCDGSGMYVVNNGRLSSLSGKAHSKSLDEVD